MIYLVGGASRSGKSLLASRILAAAAVPWLSLDVLRLGLARGAPALGLDPDADDLDEAMRLWPIVRAMAENMIDEQGCRTSAWMAAAQRYLLGD